MKRIIIISLMVLAACAQQTREQKVMARYVPERSDDFVFENNLIAGRIYGEALEGNPTSPGIDIWVKRPGALVADKRYRDELENGRSYHIDWGDGKDCYKVAVSLGGGASAPFIGGRICYPATNYREWEILRQSPDEVVFTLSYPEWEADGIRISLKKTVTVTADTYFCKVDDVYTFEGADEIEVAAGVFRHPDQGSIVRELVTDKAYAIWEHASDQSVEPEDGMLGVAVCCPDAGSVSVSPDGTHGLVCRSVRSGETFSYLFGSCWSKGDLKTAEDWFARVLEAI